MTVNAARQRLNIEVGSDSAKVFIDGEPYVAADGARLEFALDADVRLLADGREVGSGTSVNAAADYTLVRSHPDTPDVKAITRVNFICE